MEIKTKRFRLVGVAPLLLHNVQRFIDVTDPTTKEFKRISSKRAKTETDHEDMSRLEFALSLYVDDKGRPIMPGDNLQALIVEGAKLSKKGKQAQAGAWVEEDSIIEYEGPRYGDDLFKDSRFVDKRPVRVQGSRVMRTRPKFQQWAIEFTVSYLPEILNEGDLEDAIHQAGFVKGLGDFRPRYGRYTVEEVAA